MEPHEPDVIPPVEQAPVPLPRDSRLIVAVLTLILGSAGFVLIGAPAQILNLSWGLLFTEAFVFLAIPWVVLSMFGHSPTHATTFAPFKAGLFSFGVLIGLVNFIAWAVPSVWAATHIFPKSIVELFDGSVVFQNQTPLELAFIMIGVSVAAPLCEEYFFRGAVQRNLPLERPAAIVITAFVFSAMHLDPVGFLTRFELGVVFGLMSWRYNSLWPGIGAHFAHNSISSLTYFASDQKTEEELDWWVAALFFVIGNVVLFAVVQFGSRIHAAESVASTRIEPPSLLKTMRPWLIASLLSVITLLAIDHRGVRLSLFDITVPVDRPKRSAPEEETARYDNLMKSRADARAGTIDFTDYFNERKSLHAAQKK